MKLSLILLSAVALVAHAENWPQWRGPRLDGTSAEMNRDLPNWSMQIDFTHEHNSRGVVE
jgi:hypothetical protein